MSILSARIRKKLKSLGLEAHRYGWDYGEDTINNLIADELSDMLPSCFDHWHPRYKNISALYNLSIEKHDNSYFVTYITTNIEPNELVCVAAKNISDALGKMVVSCIENGHIIVRKSKKSTYWWKSIPE